MQTGHRGNYEASVSFGEYGAPDFDSRGQTISSAGRKAAPWSVEAQVEELVGLAPRMTNGRPGEVRRIRE